MNISAAVKVENTSLRWSRGNVVDKIKVLEADVGSTLKAVSASAQKDLTQVAQLVEFSFSEHKK